MRVAVYAPKQRLPVHHLPPSMAVQNCYTAEEFRQEFATCELAVVDFRQPLSVDISARMEQLLSAHPFVKVVAIISSSGLSGEAGFRLGQLGIWKLLSAKEADDGSVWKRMGHELQAISLLDRFRWHMQPLARQIAAPLLTLFIAHVQAPAVKQLVHRAPICHAKTVAGRRRALWRQCQEEDLGPPEDVLFGVRLLFIKTVLDEGHWSHEKLAAYLEYSSVSAMWRSVKRRAQQSPRTLRAMPVHQLREHVTTHFVRRKPAST